MNCRRVQRLLPLFVEDDLNASVSGRVAAHLEWCGRCNWLADDYRESQAWLRATPTPEFGEALLDGLKKDVLTEIAAARPKASTLALIARRWNHRQVLALSAALLIVFFTLVIYLNRSQPGVSSIQEQADDNSDNERAPANNPSGTNPAPGANLSPHRFAPNRHRAPAHLARQVVPRDAPGPDFSTTASNRPLPLSRGSDAIDSKDVLRIEIQTSDPLIRIIWFAPKESDQHQSKPATD